MTVLLAMHVLSYHSNVDILPITFYLYFESPRNRYHFDLALRHSFHVCWEWRHRTVCSVVALCLSNAAYKRSCCFSCFYFPPLHSILNWSTWIIFQTNRFLLLLLSMLESKDHLTLCLLPKCVSCFHTFCICKGLCFLIFLVNSIHTGFKSFVNVRKLS